MRSETMGCMVSGVSDLGLSDFLSSFLIISLAEFERAFRVKLYWSDVLEPLVSSLLYI